jgi:hypothetical protein
VEKTVQANSRSPYEAAKGKEKSVGRHQHRVKVNGNVTHVLSEASRIGYV